MKHLHIRSAHRRQLEIATRSMIDFRYSIETKEELDGSWLAEVTDLPCAIAYGETQQEAIANAEALALRALADQIEEHKTATAGVSFACVLSPLAVIQQLGR